MSLRNSDAFIQEDAGGKPGRDMEMLGIRGLSISLEEKKSPSDIPIVK